jgi:hypothetical protein
MISVSLASPDGRVVSSGVAGLLVAAVGSFLAGSKIIDRSSRIKRCLQCQPATTLQHVNWKTVPYVEKERQNGGSIVYKLK